MNYLHRIADRLNAAADELEQAAVRDARATEALWAKHFREDAKSIRLLAETAREVEV